MTEKARLRQRFRERRKYQGHLQEAIQKGCVTLVTTLVSNKKMIGLYWPLADEVDLRPLRSTLVQSIALPVADGNGGLQYRLWDERNLAPDGCNIPAPAFGEALHPSELSLLLVPGLSVDRRGIRLGYGGGYYDRLRADPAWAAVPAWVVLPSCCISDNPLPSESWDVPFDGWICETGAGRSCS